MKTNNIKIEIELEIAKKHIEVGDAAIDLSESINEYRHAKNIYGSLGKDIDHVKTKIFAKILCFFREGEKHYINKKFKAALEIFEQVKQISEEEKIILPELGGFIKRTSIEIKFEDLIKIHIKDQMHCDVEYRVPIEVNNQVSESIQLSIDLSEAKKYFKISECNLDFPPIKKNDILRRYISMTPIYEGTLTFRVKISSSIENRTKDITVVVKDPGEKVDVNRYKNHTSTLKAHSNIKWDDIGGLHELKHIIMRNIILSKIDLPIAIKPFKTLLLYGPPGTGKSLLASAAAGSIDASF